MFPAGSVGRLDNEIYIYRQQCKRKLCDTHKQRKAENVYITLFRGLSLKEYVTARSADCQIRHMQPCSECSAMIRCAVCVLYQEYCIMCEAFRLSLPDKTYKACIAMQHFL